MLLTQQFTEIDNQTSRKDGTPLFWSCCLGYKDLAEVLLLNGADVNKSTSWGATPLHACADNNRVDIMTLLLQFNADVDRQTKNGDTPLHLASYRGHSQCVRCLVEQGADVERRNKKRQTPLTEAYSGGHCELYKYLKAVKSLNLARNSTKVDETCSNNSGRPQFESTTDSSVWLSQSLSTAQFPEVPDYPFNKQFREVPHDAVASQKSVTSGISKNFRFPDSAEIRPKFTDVKTNFHKDTEQISTKLDVSGSETASIESCDSCSNNSDTHVMRRLSSCDLGFHDKKSVIGVLRVPQADFFSEDFPSLSTGDLTSTNDLSSTFLTSESTHKMTFKNI